MEKILLSACLAGVPCRYDGASKQDARVALRVRDCEVVLVCPEQLGGLSTPRPRHEIRNGRVISEHGEDRTEDFLTGAREALRTAQTQGCRRAILKARSPSCGKGLVYDGTFTGRTVAGNGLTAALLLRSGIEVQTEEEL